MKEESVGWTIGKVSKSAGLLLRSKLRSYGGRSQEKGMRGRSDGKE